MSQFNHNFITAMIDRYGLELDDYRIDNLVVTWLGKYDSTWIIKAIVESLHRGRYKVKSVDSILSGWQRVGKPSYKFSAEFEREILQKLPPIPDPPEEPVPQILSSPEPEFSAPPVVRNIEDLNPEESAPFQHHNHSTPTVHHPIEHREPIVERKDRNLANSQPRFLAIFQGKTILSEDNNDEVKTTPIICQPAQRQLFNTLKAIVSPNDRKAKESPDPTNLDGEPIYTNEEDAGGLGDWGTA
jgi:hypothetical protein